jgi:3-isopropylmalate/(R)-2-methylmalate dehydratase small subunit
MTGWTEHTGAAIALPIDNIDTDQLIPARFMSAPRSAGYGGFLLHDLRRDAQGALLPDFPLNRCPATSILIAGRNFGSGSSREAAVYALIDAGIRVVIAPGFGDIFAANAVNNGLLPAKVTGTDAAALLKGHAQPSDLHIDLAARTITGPTGVIPFDLPDTWQRKLVNGWDDIDLTASNAADIAAFRADRHRNHPWAWPATVD